MKPIKMADLHRQYLKIKLQVDKSIQEVIDSTSFINGKAVTDFARQLSHYLKVKYVIPCANGTDALQIAMMALELKPGDEVIVPSHTYVATAEVIALLKLTPVFIDVQADTFNIAIDEIQEKITDKTKAIVPVHLYGQCAYMEPLLSIAAKHGIYVIEDTAQALGAEYTFANGLIKKAGAMGTIGTTSFFPSKNLGAYGDGGAIFTDDDALAERCQMMANHGQKTKYRHDMVGCNSRLDSIQAAVLSVKLRYLDQYNATRRKVAERYSEAFKTIDTLSAPYQADYSNHVFHQYTLKADNRDTLKAYLQSKGIPSVIYYPIPIHEQKPYAIEVYNRGRLPVTEALKKQVISLPMHTELESSQQDYIIEQIKSHAK